VPLKRQEPRALTVARVEIGGELMRRGPTGAGSNSAVAIMSGALLSLRCFPRLSFGGLSGVVAVVDRSVACRRCLVAACGGLISWSDVLSMIAH
jgi:hypothetical protein